MKVLKEACTPRDEIYDPMAMDPREDIEALYTGKLGIEFFERTHITESLEKIISQTLRRLCGDNPTAVIKLKQAMGGGKTHSQLAVGLLAKNPTWVKGLLPNCAYIPEKATEVIVIDGRQTYPHGIWQHIAERLGNPTIFEEESRLLRAPGEQEWRNLLTGKQVLILIDELPPYLERSKGVQVGHSNLSVQTCAAISNLLVALTREGTEKCLVIISDLVTEYVDESAEITRLINRVTREIDRGCEEIEPVNLGSEEVYQILRKRIFSGLPDKKDIDNIRKGYHSVLSKGSEAKLCTEDIELQSRKILETYPFSPAFKDLFTRFRHNPKFRQTRGMLKMLAAVTASIWKNGRADEDFLIGPEHIDLQDPTIAQEVDIINGSLKNALIRDISNRTNDSTIEIEATREGAHNWIGDAGRILFFASLSTNDLEQGFTATELGTACASPNRDLDNLGSIIDTLRDTCRYLHQGENMRLRFRNVENIRAWVKHTASELSDSRKEAFIKVRLQKLFAPTQKLLYKQVLALPSNDEIELEVDKLTLLILQPCKLQEAQEKRKGIFESQRLKNRVLILTGSKNGWKSILEEASILDAITTGLNRNDLSEGSSERKDLQDMEKKHERDFRERILQSFGEVCFPVGKELDQATIRLVLEEGHKDSGENQIVSLLKEVGKYEEFTMPNDWVETAEVMLFSGKSTLWKEVEEKSAENGEWPWGKPGALAELKELALEAGWWKKDGESRIEKGPFASSPTYVSITELNDGLLRLDVNPPDAILHYAIGPTCTDSSAILEERENYKPESKTLSFLAVDPDKLQPTGVVIVWEGRPSLKQDVQENLTVILETDDPEADILYTEDGSDPITSNSAIKYVEPFQPGDNVDQVKAVAKKSELTSKTLTFVVGRRADTYGHIAEKAKPVIWDRTSKSRTLGSSNINSLLAYLENHNGKTSGSINLEVKSDSKNRMDLAAYGMLTSEKIRVAIEQLISLLDGTESAEARSLKISKLHFPNLDSLKEFASDIKERVNPRDVESHS